MRLATIELCWITRWESVERCNGVNCNLDMYKLCDIFVCNARPFISNDKFYFQNPNFHSFNLNLITDHSYQLKPNKIENKNTIFSNSPDVGAYHMLSSCWSIQYTIENIIIIIVKIIIDNKRRHWKYTLQSTEYWIYSI